MGGELVFLVNANAGTAKHCRESTNFMNRFVNQFLVAAIVLSAPVVFAGPEPYDISKEAPPPPPQPWCETPATLEIRIGVPGWLAGVSGNSGVKGVVTDVDVSFDQILTHLTHVPFRCRLMFAISGGSSSEMVSTWM